VDQVIQSNAGPCWAAGSRRVGWGFVIAVLLVLAAWPCLAQSPRASETEIEAAYLYNFGKFVTWPAQPEPFEICVLGKDPFGPVLDATVSGETIGTRRVVVSRIASAREAAGCQVLFISDQEEGHLKTILAAVKNVGVLTVSDMPRFAERGGMIEFLQREGRIRFEVNLEAAQQSKLMLSSELLKVAVKIVGKSEVEDRR
jgi:hypothetical protein